MTWKVEILNQRVKKELRIKFLYIAEMIEEFGPHNVKEPFVKQIKINSSRIKMWEIRMKSQSGIARAIYIIKHTKIVILHAFIKKEQKTKKRHIDLSIKRSKEV